MLWALWYLGWGHTAHTFVSFHNAAKVPSYVLDGLSSSISAYLGLSPAVRRDRDARLSPGGAPSSCCSSASPSGASTGSGRPSNRLWVTLAILLSYWSLTGLNTSIFGLPTVGRYQYLGVVALALVASELLRGARIGRWATAGILVVAVLATLEQLHQAQGCGRRSGGDRPADAWRPRGVGARARPRRPGPRAQSAELGRGLHRPAGRAARTSPRSTPTAPRLHGGRAPERAGARPGRRGQGVGARARYPSPARRTRHCGNRCLRVDAARSPQRPGPGRRLRHPRPGRRRGGGASPVRRSQLSRLVRHAAARSAAAASDPAGSLLGSLDASAHGKRRSSRLPGRDTVDLDASPGGSVRRPPSSSCAAATSGILLIAWQSHLTFLYDDWDPLLHRAWSAHDLLRPHFEHIILGDDGRLQGDPGDHSGWRASLPYAVASTSVFLLSVALLFVYMRRRVGRLARARRRPPDPLHGSGRLGPARTSSRSSSSGRWRAGSGRCSRSRPEAAEEIRWPASSCSVRFTFSELALPFVLGVAVAIALDRGPLGVAYVVVRCRCCSTRSGTPAGDTPGPATLSFDNVANSLGYVLDGFASRLASLFGLGTPILLGGNGGLDWGRSLLVGLAVLAAWGLLRQPRGRSRFLIPLSAGLVFWLETAANFGLGRPPDASRYQYVGAVFLLMMAADYLAGQLPGWRPDWRSWRVLAPVFAVAAAATAANFSTLHDAYDSYRVATSIVRSDLAALEIARDGVNPGFVLTPENSGFEYFGYVVAGPYSRRRTSSAHRPTHRRSSRRHPRWRVRTRTRSSLRPCPSASGRWRPARLPRTSCHTINRTCGHPRRSPCGPARPSCTHRAGTAPISG